MKTRTIPVFWFGLVLLLWIVSYWIAFGGNVERIERIDAFMASGDRFTREDGNALEVRVYLLELQVAELCHAQRIN